MSIQHRTRESKWEAVSIWSGFIGLREDIQSSLLPKRKCPPPHTHKREQGMWSRWIHRRVLRKLQNPYQGWSKMGGVDWVFKCEGSNARLQGVWKIKEICHYQRNNFPVTNPKEMEICDLPNKEFKIVVLRKLTELQENTGRWLNEIRKTIHKQHEKFNREIKIIKIK